MYFILVFSLAVASMADLGVIFSIGFLVFLLIYLMPISGHLFFI